MDHKVLVSDIVTLVGATDDDVQALDPKCQQMIRTDGGGSDYVEADDRSYLRGALFLTVQRRKEARVGAADARLVKAYAELKAAPKPSAGQAARQVRMLDLFTEVRDALVELCDAKVDAKAMKPATAESLRAQANRVLRAAERNASRTYNQLLALARSRA